MILISLDRRVRRGLLLDTRSHLRHDRRRRRNGDARCLGGQTADAADDGTPATVEEFIDDILVIGLRTGDIDRLIERLHPEVIALYGLEACRAYFPNVIDPDVAIVVGDVGAPEPWDWATEGRIVSLDNAIPVQVSLTTRGDTANQVLHLVEIDGTLRWFSDCGDPTGDGSP